jgi:hypothetical protein
MNKSPVVPTPPNPELKTKGFTWKGRSDIKVLKPHSVDVDQIFRELNSRK